MNIMEYYTTQIGDFFIIFYYEYYFFIFSYFFAYYCILSAHSYSLSINILRYYEEYYRNSHHTQVIMDFWSYNVIESEYYRPIL